jgi:hypothetical protein
MCKGVLKGYKIAKIAMKKFDWGSKGREFESLRPDHLKAPAFAKAGAFLVPSPSQYDNTPASTHLQAVRGTTEPQISLTDRWFNPTNSAIEQFACFTFPLTPMSHWETDVRHKCQAGWHLNDKKATLISGNHVIQLPQAAINGRDGLSHLNLQSLAESADPFGVMIDSVQFKMLNVQNTAMTSGI